MKKNKKLELKKFDGTTPGVETSKLTDNPSETYAVNYERLYHTAFKQLTALHQAIEKVQIDLEDMYLNESKPAHLKVVKAK